MGRLIPAGTGLERYRNIQLLTEMPPPPPPEEIMPPAELSAEEAAALDFLRKDADALAEGGRTSWKFKQRKNGRPLDGPPVLIR